MKGVFKTGWAALGFKSYNEYLESKFWEMRKGFLLDGKCCHCGSKKGLVVHHLNYDNLGNEKGRDVCTLCWECHRKEHDKKR